MLVNRFPLPERKTATRYGVPLYFRYTGSKIVTSFSSFGSQIETKCSWWSTYISILSPLELISFPMRRKIYQFFPRLSRNPRWISASQGYGRVAPCRMASDAHIQHKPLIKSYGLRTAHPHHSPTCAVVFCNAHRRFSPLFHKGPWGSIIMPMPPYRALPATQGWWNAFIARSLPSPRRFIRRSATWDLYL